MVEGRICLHKSFFLLIISISRLYMNATYYNVLILITIINYTYLFLNAKTAIYLYKYVMKHLNSFFSYHYFHLSHKLINLKNSNYDKIVKMFDHIEIKYFLYIQR